MTGREFPDMVGGGRVGEGRLAAMNQKLDSKRCGDFFEQKCSVIASVRACADARVLERLSGLDANPCRSKPTTNGSVAIGVHVQANVLNFFFRQHGQIVLSAFASSYFIFFLFKTRHHTPQPALKHAIKEAIRIIMKYAADVDEKHTLTYDQR
jgi:hypothetical protein